MGDWDFASNDMYNKKQRKRMIQLSQKNKKETNKKQNNKTGTNLKNQSEPMAH